MEKRLSKAGDDDLANKLLKEQHKAAAALTNAFYLNHRVEEEGEFVAYKMTRTLVERPRGHVGVAVQNKFDGTIYQGDIIDYCDHKQWWRVEFKDGNFEDWSVPDMKNGCLNFCVVPSLTEPRRTLLPPCARDLGKGGFVADPIQWPQWLKK
jgi:hypothetical protein